MCVGGSLTKHTMVKNNVKDRGSGNKGHNKVNMTPNWKVIQARDVLINSIRGGRGNCRLDK